METAKTKPFKFSDKFSDEEKADWERLKSTPGQRGVESRRLFMQGYFKRNFDAFVYLLGYRDLGEFHKKQLHAIASVRKLGELPSRRLWLWSRGFFKTSLITEAHSLWLIVNNVDIRILLVSNTISVAEDILRNIKNHFIANQDFRYFFREYCPKENAAGKIEFGTSQDFTLPNRRKASKEPTMMVAGIGTNLTGLHFDYQKVDDLVTRDSVTNDTQIQASKDYYSSLRPLFDKAALPREDIVGTIYHFNDLYGLLRKSALFQESFVPARINGVAVFPERLPEDELVKLINDPSVGPYQFQTQYMLNPINPAEAKFKEEWLKEYERQPEGLAEYICVDPASTVKKKSDYTVIQRWGIDNSGKHYLLDGIRDKLTAFQRIDALFEIVSRSKNLKWVKYEVIGGRHGDLEVIQQRQMQTKNFFQVKETKSTNASKVDRIEQRLVGAYHSGLVLLPRNLFFRSKYDGKTHDFVAQLKLEYLQFPFTEHDDILDCQAQMFEEQLVLGKEIKEKEEKKSMTADDWDQMYQYISDSRKKYKGMSYQKQNEMMAAERLRSFARRVS